MSAVVRRDGEAPSLHPISRCHNHICTPQPCFSRNGDGEAPSLRPISRFHSHFCAPQPCFSRNGDGEATSLHPITRCHSFSRAGRPSYRALAYSLFIFERLSQNPRICIKREFDINRLFNSAHFCYSNDKTYRGRK